jgi:membrane-associated PAP2 superfamily phosphatase
MTDLSPTPRPFDLQKTLWPVVGLLLAVFALFELTNLDLWVQDFFFDFTNGKWLVDAKEPVARALFYNGPKYVIILIGLTTLVFALARIFHKKRVEADRRVS